MNEIHTQKCSIDLNDLYKSPDVLGHSMASCIQGGTSPVAHVIQTRVSPYTVNREDRGYARAHLVYSCTSQSLANNARSLDTRAM